LKARARALTLIEVVASLAILGTLLVSMLMARQRYSRQWTLAVRKGEAVSAADQLLSEWWRDPRKLPLEGRGVIAGHPDLMWRTRTMDNRDADALDAQVVRLEVFTQAERQKGNTQVKEKALATVDLLLPKPEEAGDAP
jgi:hypothetical protein